MHNKPRDENVSHFKGLCPKFTPMSRCRQNKGRQPIHCMYSVSACVHLCMTVWVCVCERGAEQSRAPHPVARLNHCLTSATLSLINVWEVPSTIYAWPSIFPPWRLKRIIMPVKNLRENNISALCKFRDCRQMFPWPKNTKLSNRIKTYRCTFQYFLKPLMKYTCVQFILLLCSRVRAWTDTQTDTHTLAWEEEKSTFCTMKY